MVIKSRHWGAVILVLFFCLLLAGSVLAVDKKSAAGLKVVPLTQVLANRISAVQRMLERDQLRLVHLKNIQVALEIFYTDHQKYPPGKNIYLGTGRYVCLNQKGWQKKCKSNYYMNPLPKDPKKGYYIYTRTKDGFEIRAYGFEMVKANKKQPVIAEPAGIKNINEGLFGKLSIKNKEDEQIISFLEKQTPSPEQAEGVKIKVRNNQRLSSLLDLKAALVLYFVDQGQYPPGNKLPLGIDKYVCLNKGGFNKAGWSLSFGCLSGYIAQISVISGESYLYSRLGNDVDYIIESVFEILNKPSRKIFLTSKGFEDFSNSLEKNVLSPEETEMIRVRARDAGRLSNLKQIQTALELYYIDKAKYPVGQFNLGEAGAKCLTQDGFGENKCRSSLQFSVYMGQIGRDTVGGRYFVYQGNGQTYTIEAEIEGEISGLKGKIIVSPSGIKMAN